MRAWKSLLAARTLFKEPTIVGNRLILTLTAENEGVRNLRSVSRQLQNIYKNSLSFQHVFSTPQHVGQTIALELKKRYRHLSANAALEKLVGFVIPALAPLSRNEVKANRQAEKQLAIKKALSEGKLFKAVEQSGDYINLIISDKFNHNSNFPVICRALQALHNENAAFRAIFHDIPFSKRKPQLRLKQQGELNIASLLTTSLAAVEPIVAPVQPDIAPVVVQANVTATVVQADVAEVGYDDFFNNLPDLFENFFDSESSSQPSPDPLLFKYTPPYVSTDFDLESLLSNGSSNPVDFSLKSEFEECFTKRRKTIKA